MLNLPPTHHAGLVVDTHGYKKPSVNLTVSRSPTELSHDLFTPERVWLIHHKPALLADFLQFQEGMAQAGHMPLKGRCAMLTPSTTNTKPPHFSLTLTSSHCLIMLPNMAPFGPKLLGCTSPNPSKHGFSPVHLASLIAETLSFQATARLLSLRS